MQIELSDAELKELIDALDCWREENGSGMTGEWLQRVSTLRQKLAIVAGVRPYS